MIDYGQIARDAFALEAQLATESNANGWSAPTDDDRDDPVSGTGANTVCDEVIAALLADMRAAAVAEVRTTAPHQYTGPAMPGWSS